MGTIFLVNIYIYGQTQLHYPARLRARVKRKYCVGSALVYIGILVTSTTIGGIVLVEPLLLKIPGSSPAMLKGTQACLHSLVSSVTVTKGLLF